MRAKKAVAITVLVALFAGQTARAQMEGLRSKSYLLPDDAFTNKISEYFYARNSREVLHPVSIFGKVPKPGLYHVPLETELVTLIAISGGVMEPQNVERIVVQSKSGERKEVDFKALVAHAGDYKLKQDDVILIEERRPILSGEMTNVILVTTGLLSVLLTAVVVSRAH